MFATAADRAGLQLDRRLPAAARAGVRRPRPVGQDRAQPAVQRLEVHVRRAAITVRLPRPGGGAELEVDRHRHRHPARRSGRACSSGSTGSRARASRTHEGSGIGLALVAELAALHGGRSASTQRARRRAARSRVRVPLGAAHLPAGPGRPSADGDAGATARTGQAAGRSSPRPRAGPTTAAPASDAADAAGRPRRDGRPRPRVLVVDDNADIREYVAGLLAARLRRGDRRRRRRRARAGAARAARPGADRRDDAADGRLRAARGAAGGPADRRRAGGACCRPAPARRAPSRASTPARTTTWSSRSRPASCWPGCAPTSSSTGPGVPARQLERSRRLLDQAAAAGPGRQLGDRPGHAARSWRPTSSCGIVRLPPRSSRAGRRRALVAERVAPRRPRPGPGGCSSRRCGPGSRVDYERGSCGRRRRGRVLSACSARCVRDAHGRPAALRGAVQDITEQRAAEEALATAAANAEAAAREHAIADQLQRSLLPAAAFDLEHLEVATYYRAGVEGTQVGGDWYDVIELGGGRTALVVGDVMGRGVRAAAVMGQLRAGGARLRPARPAARPTCWSPSTAWSASSARTRSSPASTPSSTRPTGCSRFANAGHLPPMRRAARRQRPPARRAPTSPPLGVGAVQPHRAARSTSPPGAGWSLYTDGLVERRGRTSTRASRRSRGRSRSSTGRSTRRPEELVAAMLPGRPRRRRGHPGGAGRRRARTTSMSSLKVRDDVAAVRRGAAPAAAVPAERALDPTLVEDAPCAAQRAGDQRAAARPAAGGAADQPRRAPTCTIEVHDSAPTLPRGLRPGRRRRARPRPADRAALLARWGTRRPRARQGRVVHPRRVRTARATCAPS